MEIEEITEDDVVVVAPRGRLNTYTSPVLDKSLQAVIARKQKLIVLDLAGVDYLTSAALRVLLATSRRLKPLAGRLALCSMNDGVRKVFAISGFERDFPILNSREEALEIVRSSGGTLVGRARRHPALPVLLEALGIPKAAPVPANTSLAQGMADAAAVLDALTPPATTSR